MANGDLIKQVREQLEKPKGMTGKNAQVMTLTLLADLYEKWQEDHDKIEKMWPAYNFAMWIGGALGLANIGLVVGIFTHSFRFVP